MNGFWKRKFMWDILIALSIIVLPFGLYLHMLYNTETAVVHIFGYPYQTGYADISAFVWHFLSMLIPILLMLLWYFSAYHLFRYSILIPLLLFEFHLIHNVIELPTYIEKHILLFTLLFLGFTLLIILLIDRITFKKLNGEVMQYDFKSLFDNSLKQKIKQYHQHTKSIKSYGKKNQIKQLYNAKLTLNSLIDESIPASNYRLNRKVILFIKGIFLILPLLFFLYKLIPENVKSYGNNWLEIGSYGFPDIHIFIFYVNLKLCILIPLCIWFVTSKDWWKYAIISPIIVFTYQLWEAVQETDLADVTSFGKALPWVVILVALLIYVSNRIKDQSRILDMHEEISNEIDDLLLKLESSNQTISGIRNYFELLKRNTSVNKTKEQLDQLIELKNKLLKEVF